MSEYMEPQHQWFSRPRDQRYETLADLQVAVEARRSRARVETIESSELEVHAMPNGGVGLVGSKLADVLVPTHYGFGQLCQRAKSPAAYLRTLPNDLVSQCLTHKLTTLTRADDKPEQSMLLAELDEASDTTFLRCDTSPTYGRIWDAEVVEFVRRLQEAHPEFDNPLEWGGKKSGLYASDRDVFMFLVDGGSIVDGGGERDQLHRGFYVWNSEVGAAILGIATFLFRQVCGNHGIWGGEQFSELRIRHTSGGPAKFVSEAMPALLTYANASAKPLEAKIKAAKAYELPYKPGATELIEWGKAHALTSPEIKGAVSYCQREEGADPSNLWLLIQGLTAYARDMAWIDARVDVERRAGKLMALAA